MDTTVTGTSPADGRVGNAPFGLTGLAVIVLIAVVGFVFVAVALERARTPIMTPDRLHASVALAVSSEAYVKMPGSETFQEIVGSVPLEAGAEITTSPSGRAFIASPNGALTIVKENTHIIISELGANGNQTRLTLLGGAIRARVERLLSGDEYYTVQSGDIVTSVRGTAFEIERTGAATAVTVVQSEVALTAIETAATDGAQSVVYVASGEKITLDDGALLGEDVAQTKRTLTKEELETLIAERPDFGFIQRSAALGLIDSRAAEDASVAAGALPGTPLYAFKQFVEYAAVATTFGEDAKAQRHLARAERRLFEALALAERGDPSAERALEKYQESLSDFLSAGNRTIESDVRELIARSTLAHQEVLDAVLEKIPEQARTAVLHAQAVSEQGHLEAVRSLGAVAPERAFGVAVESMEANMRSAQKESVQRNSVSTFNTLRQYDRMTRVASDIVLEGRSLDLNERYADELHRSLTAIETLDTLSPSLLPGITRSIDEVRSRSVDSQLASLAPLAVERSERAVAAFAKTADYYVERLQDKARRGEDTAGAFSETVSSYSDFGSEIASLARATRGEEAAVRELVQRATAHHVEVLSDVRGRVPEVARPAIDRAISDTSSTQRAAPPVRATDPEEFKREREVERAKEDIAPESFGLPALPTVRPSVAPEQPRPDVAPQPTRTNVVPEPVKPDAALEQPRPDVAPQPTRTNVVPEPVKPDAALEQPTPSVAPQPEPVRQGTSQPETRAAPSR